MSDKSSTDLAEDRTDWAEDRTILANERTFAGWMRTGMASLGMGLAIHAIYGKADQTIMAKGASTLFVVIAVMIFLQAFLASRKLLKRLNSHSAEPTSPRKMAITAGLLSSGAISIGALLWTI